MKERMRHKVLGPNYDPLAVEAPQGPRVVYWYRDMFSPYLRLKVTAHSRIWYFDKTFDGKHLQRRMMDARLMGLPQARQQSFEWAKELEEKCEPIPTLKQRIQQNKSKTYKECFEAYLAGHLEPHCSSHTTYDAKRGFERFFERFHNVYAKHISRHDIQTWLNWVGAEFGKDTANKQLRFFAACLNWCNDQELIELVRIPTKGINKFAEVSRTRYLKPREFSQLVDVLQTVQTDIADAILMLLFTGCRRGNVLSMRWEDVDMETEIWCIPKTKNGKPHMAPLTEPALKILRRRRQSIIDRDWVFPSVGGTGHLINLNQAWERIRVQAGLADVRLHDLRHTAASMMGITGANGATIQRALGHATSQMTDRYTHLDTSPVRAAMEKAQAHLFGGYMPIEEPPPPAPAAEVPPMDLRLYKLGKLCELGSPPKPKRVQRYLQPNSRILYVSPEDEEAILAVAKANPGLGRARLGTELSKQGHTISRWALQLVLQKHKRESMMKASSSTRTRQA